MKNFYTQKYPMRTSAPAHKEKSGAHLAWDGCASGVRAKALPPLRHTTSGREGAHAASMYPTNWQAKQTATGTAKVALVAEKWYSLKTETLRH